MSDAPHEPMPEGEEPPPPGVRVMAVVRWVLVGALAIAAIAAWSRYEDRAKPAASAGPKATYLCPMHPAVVQDHPGSCPICGMDLVLHEQGAPLDPSMLDPANVPGLAVVQLGADRVQLLGMRTTPVRQEKLTPKLRVVGTITVDEERVYRVPVRVSGWVESLGANQTGQAVEKGQLLARIGSPDVLAATREFVQLRTGGDPSLAPLVQDARRRLELLGMGSADLAALEKNAQPTQTLEIRAPASGVVTSKAAVEGLAVQAGMELFEIADLSSIWVIAQVPETELARVAVGQRAELQLAAFPGQTLSGRVSFLSPSLDAQARTLPVRLTFPNPGRTLRPGMTGDVTVALPSLEGFVVPAEAIVDTGDRRYVYVALPEGRFVPRTVTVGAREGDRVQILDGLSDGDVVVTTGNFLLDSESRLKGSLDAVQR